MYYVRLLFEEFDKLSIDTRCDLMVALRDGLKSGALSKMQVTALALLTYGYTALEISTMLDVHLAEHLNAALRYISAYLNYKDEHVIYARKGVIKPEWVAKAEHLAQQWY